MKRGMKRRQEKITNKQTKNQLLSHKGSGDVGGRDLSFVFYA